MEKNISDFIDFSSEIQVPISYKTEYNPSEILPIPPKKINLDYWDYMKMSWDKLKELTSNSNNDKIQDIRKWNWPSYKQRSALCIYLASKGKFDDYTYLSERLYKDDILDTSE